ncbi:conjugal transfer protein TrbL [Agrobacterium tumefaciens]|uniref:Conjugal transfer protein TrbL n=1 Tax=Agrobacterium tumefaciens TaxID=358 RepID=A0A0D0KFN0_AGRTU|nr:conjugal transfer protein TrbL [Agrobacterium tumefaciens]
MNNFVTNLLMRIDQLGSGFAQRAYGIVGDEVMPVLRVALIVYVALYGIQLMLGLARISLGDFVSRIVKFMLILTLVQNWSVFNSLFYSWLSDTPEDLGRAILMASSSGITEPTNGLSMIVATAFNAASALAQQSGYFTILPSVLGGIIVIGALVVVAIALAIIILSKVMMWVLVGTGPLFIACMLFNQTRSLGAAWFTQVFLYSLIPLFVYVVSAFLIAAINPELSKIEVAVASNALDVSHIGAFALLCIAGMFVLLNVQSLAQGITGGFGASTSATGYAYGKMATISPVAALASKLRSRGSGGGSSDRETKGGSITNRSGSETNLQDRISSLSKPS